MYGGGRFREIRRFPELDSTNRYLLDEARAGAAAGLVVVADYQTAGRGRLDRRWEAPAGTNLLASILLRPSLAPGELHLCTVAMALAARSALAEVGGIEPQLKWPNDVMVGERKVAGILAEAIPGAVVVGIGVNVAWPPPDDEPGADQVPSELNEATSLWREARKPDPWIRPDPGSVLEVLLDELGPRIDDLADADGLRRLASEYRGACGTLGREVAVSLEGETVRGRVVDITVEGQLLVDVGACIRTITAGDVVHLRG
jgi:BirA family transcriptional regulator, biotin operon repressor / biotin---[acetyl-CoA-carboxylase] ligase